MRKPYEDEIQFLKDNKSLLQHNKLDELFKLTYSSNAHIRVKDHDIVNFLIHECKVPILNYMTTIYNNMFTYFSDKSLIIPDNIKYIHTNETFYDAFHGMSLNTLTINSITNKVLNNLSSSEIDTIIINENITTLHPAKNSTVKKIILPKSCTRLSNGFDGYDFIIETPYRENQNEKLRVSENDLGWARTHIKFIHEPQTEELVKKKHKNKNKSMWYFPDKGSDKVIDRFNNSVNYDAPIAPSEAGISDGNSVSLG